MKAMTELRFTETNAADDSSGRAFGLDGNLYLPVLCATVGALGLFALLTQAFKVHLALALLVAGLPWSGVLGWALWLKQGRPAGFDLDFCQQVFGGGNFTRSPRDQRGLAG
jgi:hypothetical protein